VQVLVANSSEKGLLRGFSATFADLATMPIPVGFCAAPSPLAAS
jgi:hypothetical protein